MGNVCKQCPSLMHSGEGSGKCSICNWASGEQQIGDSCVACTAGKYLNKNSQSCESCPRGTYQQNMGKIKCDTCPSGRTTAGLNTIASGNCVPCDAGMYSKQESSTSLVAVEQICLECPVGKVSLFLVFWCWFLDSVLVFV